MSESADRPQPGSGVYVYDFADGRAGMADLLGGKGANLAEMTWLGLPVPPGCTVTTEACRAYLRTGRLPFGLAEQIDTRLSRLEERAGRRLGCAAWISGHAAHVHLVQAPGYLGRADAAALARAEPEAVARGLALHRIGTDLAEAVGRGAFEPCSVRIGRFRPRPQRPAVARLGPRLQDAVAQACRTVHWVCGFDVPETLLDVPLLALDDPVPGATGIGSARHPLDGGTGVLAGNGLGFPLGDFESFVSRPRAAVNRPARAALRGTRAALAGPLAPVRAVHHRAPHASRIRAGSAASHRSRRRWDQEP